MKILRLDSSSSVSRPVLMADSAWRPDRRPLFLPDTAPLTCSIRAAVRVDRLGKCVDRRFAPRYIGATTLVSYLSGGTLTDYSDDVLIHGRWIEISDLAASADIFTPDLSLAADALAGISADTTFKTGDVIVLPGDIASFIPEIGCRVSYGFDPDDPILEFNIK